MLLLGFDFNFYKSPNKFIKLSLFFGIVCLVNTKHLDNTFVLYSLKNKDSLIGSLLYFYQNVTSGICFQLL